MKKIRNLTAPYQSLCIVGNAKNAGKTTVMCAMIRAFPDKILGVSSIGLDGEDLDTVSFLPKPKVFLPAGSLVATAEKCLAQSEARLEILSAMDVRTGMGDILIARVIKPGNVLLGGPSTALGMQQASDMLNSYGAQKLLIDGAFARQSHAITGDAMVYVVGAHQSQVMEQVVASAGLALKCFALPRVDSIHDFLSARDCPGWIDDRQTFHPLPIATSLGQADALLDLIPFEANWLYLPGACNNQFVRRLVQRRNEHAFGLIVQSPLSLVMEDTQLKHLFLLERDIRVLYPLTLAMVAYNPVSPAGYAFHKEAFYAALSRETNLPLINAMEVKPIESYE